MLSFGQSLIFGAAEVISAPKRFQPQTSSFHLTVLQFYMETKFSCPKMMFVFFDEIKMFSEL